MRAAIFIGLLLVGQIADAATFSFAIPILGIGVESNALAAMIYEGWGMAGVLLLKGAAIVLMVLVLVRVAPRAPRIFSIGATTAGVVGMLGAITNLWAVALLT